MRGRGRGIDRQRGQQLRGGEAILGRAFAAASGQNIY